MTKIFNLKANNVLTQLTNSYNDEMYEVMESEDALHLLLPIKISCFYSAHNDLFMKTLKKTNVSVNGLIITADKKCIEVKRKDSHSYIHITSNTPILSSYNDFNNKVDILSKTISQQEKIILNKQLREINIENKFFTSSRQANIKLSFLEIMKLLCYTFQNMCQESINTIPSLPGGKVNSRDRTIIDTLRRELKEEVNVSIDNIDSKFMVYHNIFDKLNDRFYHNLIIIGFTKMTGYEVYKQFKENGEINQVIISDLENDSIIKLYNVINRERKRL